MKSYAHAARVSAALLPIFLLAAAPAGSDYSFEVQIKTERSGADGQTETTNRATKVMLSGDKLRLETAAQEGQEGGPTTVILLNGGKTTLTIDDANKSYTEYTPPDSAAMDSMMRAMREMGGMGGGGAPRARPEVSETKVAAEDLGAGPTIGGHPTAHHRLTEAATVKSTFGDNTMTSRTETTTDYYFASDLKDLAGALGNRMTTIINGGGMGRMGMMGGMGGMGGGSGRRMGGGMGGAMMGMMGGGMSTAMGDTAFAKQVRAEHAKLPTGGVPVKTVTTTKSTRDGATTTTVTTVVISNVKNEDLAASLFAAPEGYSKKEIPTWGGGRGGRGGGGGLR